MFVVFTALAIVKIRNQNLGLHGVFRCHSFVSPACSITVTGCPKRAAVGILRFFRTTAVDFAIIPTVVVPQEDW